MIRNIPTLVLSLLLAVVMAFSASVQAKSPSAAQLAAEAKKKQQEQQQQQQEQQQQQQQQAAAQAKAQAVNAAQKELNDAQAALNAVTLKAQAQFEASPEYVAANNELKAAQAAYDTAASAVLKKADADPAFVTAKAKSDKLASELSDLKSNGGSDDDVVGKSREVMEASSAAHKIETDAVAADPAASAAHEKLLAAQKAMDALKTDFHAKLSKTPEYATAKSAVDAADQKLVAAQRGELNNSAAAVATLKGKITGVGNNSFTISVAVTGAKNKSRIVTVTYTSGASITGPAKGTIDKSVIGQTATVIGKETGDTISASSITISAPSKKPAAA